MAEALPLEVRDLCREFGGVMAVADVSLAVARGEIRAIIGPKGAGKTTLFRAISGLLAAREGSIRFAGQELAGREAEDIVRRGVSHVPEGQQNCAELSLRNNLMVGTYPRRRRPPPGCGRRRPGGRARFLPGAARAAAPTAEDLVGGASGRCLPSGGGSRRAPA